MTALWPGIANYASILIPELSLRIFAKLHTLDYTMVSFDTHKILTDLKHWEVLNSGDAIKAWDRTDKFRVITLFP